MIHELTEIGIPTGQVRVIEVIFPRSFAHRICGKVPQGGDRRCIIGLRGPPRRQLSEQTAERAFVLLGPGDIVERVFGRRHTHRNYSVK